MSNRQSIKLEYNENKILSGYTCSICNSYNDILTHRCWNCQSYRVSELEIIAARIQIQRSGEFYNMADDNVIKKHSHFFQLERVLIKDMDNVQLRERRNILEGIAFEARAKLTAIDAEERERKSKMSKEERDWLISNQGIDPSTSEKLVKEKKQRQSKADKLLQQMKNLGIANADELIKNVERTATSKQLNNITFEKAPAVVTSAFCGCDRHTDCTGRFTDDKGSHECECSCHKLSNPPLVENKPEVSMMCDAGLHDSCLGNDCSCECHKEK